jgi:hypothetical protein
MNLNILHDLSEVEALWKEIKAAGHISATKVTNPSELQALATHLVATPTDFPQSTIGYLILFEP